MKRALYIVWRWKDELTRLRVIAGPLFLILLSVVASFADEPFFGARSLSSLYERADIIIVGKVTWKTVGITSSGKTRWPLKIEVLETIKGTLSNEAALQIEIVTHATSFVMDHIYQGKDYVFFLHKDYVSADPWFSVQSKDPAMVWGLKKIKEIEERDKGGGL